jgi:hypothetical protein
LKRYASKFETASDEQNDNDDDVEMVELPEHVKRYMKRRTLKEMLPTLNEEKEMKSEVEMYSLSSNHTGKRRARDLSINTDNWSDFERKESVHMKKKVEAYLNMSTNESTQKRKRNKDIDGNQRKSVKLVDSNEVDSSNF